MHAFVIDVAEPEPIVLLESLKCTTMLAILITEHETLRNQITEVHTSDIRLSVPHCQY